jgi:hypothetical protein
MEEMTTSQAAKHWDACNEAFQRKDPNVKMIRDSWEGGYTVQFHLAGTCIVTRTVSHEKATFCGKWL